MKFADLDLSGSYTYADYLKWAFEERIELIKGKVFAMSPAPNRAHQDVAGELFHKLKTFLEHKDCRVYIAPFDVRLVRRSKDDKDITTVLQPDVCVICDAAKLDDKGCLGAPDIVIEVLSPGTGKKEVKNKFDVYEEAGVREYWIVDPIRQTLQLNVLHDGRYVPHRTLTSGDSVQSVVLPGFSLDIEGLFSKM